MGGVGFIWVWGWGVVGGWGGGGGCGRGLGLHVGGGGGVEGRLSLRYFLVGSVARLRRFAFFVLVFSLLFGKCNLRSNFLFDSTWKQDFCRWQVLLLSHLCGSFGSNRVFVL